MAIRKVFVKKPKHQYHQSQWGECVYDAQSWKERRLLCESIFILIERQTLILKMVEIEVFLLYPKQQIVYHNKGNVFILPNHEKKGDYYVNPCLSHLKEKLRF